MLHAVYDVDCTVAAQITHSESSVRESVNICKEGKPFTHGTGFIFANRKSDDADPSGRAV